MREVYPHSWGSVHKNFPMLWTTSVLDTKVWNSQYAPGMANDDIITATEVADMYGVSAEAVRVWADERLIPSFRTPGGHRRFRRSEIEADIESRRTVPEQSAAAATDDEAAA